MRPLVIGALLGAAVGIVIETATFVDAWYALYLIFPLFVVAMFGAAGAFFGLAVMSARHYREKYGRSAWQSWLD